MLNELLVVERGARQAGVGMGQFHPDVKQARRVPTLLVRLNPDGGVGELRPVPITVTPWTLRDGQHNSFPFVQPKQPLLAVKKLKERSDPRLAIVLDKKSAARRKTLVALIHELKLNIGELDGWPGSRLLDRLRERRADLASLEGTDAAAVPATIDRFLSACDSAVGGDPIGFLSQVTEDIVAALHQATGDDWINAAAAILVDGAGALMFDAAGAMPSVLSPQVVGRVSEALQSRQPSPANAEFDQCALTGKTGKLVASKFPQPNLPVLGQTWLFARNKDIPANDRYGRFAADTMPVSEEASVRLAAALVALTTPDLRGKTWRDIPGEAPKQSDLLLAFVEDVPDSRLAELLVNDEDEDLSEEATEMAPGDASGGNFEKRCERLISAVEGAVGADFRETLVRLIVVRKVDPANRKVVYAGSPTVGALYEAARAWLNGERNVPPWLTMPIPQKGGGRLRHTHALHVGPLDMIRFSRALFIRGGTQRQEVNGLYAADALSVFLDPVEQNEGPARRRARRVLRLVLIRRGSLVSSAAHALRRGLEHGKAFDRREVLRTISVLGVLLHKLNRIDTNEDYMSGTAFRLGQLLAAADVVHVGYCADVRGGDVPPSLLGNQVFTMAQSTPVKALSTLCRRWKPYDGWARRAAHLHNRATYMIARKSVQEQERGWAIRKALRHAREMRTLARDLAPALEALRQQDVTDTFRAQLLLGYVAGLPKVQKGEDDDDTSITPTLA